MKKYRILIIALLILILGIVLYPTGALNPAKNILFIVTKPISIMANFSIDGISNFFRNLKQLGSLSSDNKKLMQENLELQSQLSILKEVQHENEILKNEMGFLSRKGDMNLLSANIIGRSSTGYIKNVIIDRGEKDNVKKGQAVVSQGFIVGTITKTFENTSEVTLVTDYNSLVPVVLEDSRGTGLLRGGLEGLTVEDIPLNIEIKKGEQVVTSGLGGEIPPGILIGKIQNVISHEGEIFQKVTVNSPIKIYFLEFVFVVQ